MSGDNSLATAYGLATALAWGTGDFSGGVASRRADYRGVVVVSQFVGGLLLFALATQFAAAFPSNVSLAYAVAGGLTGGVGLLAFYRALAIGPMGVVAPMTAVVTGIIPVIYGALRDGLPPWWKVVGCALALLAVWKLSGGSVAKRFTFRDIQLPLFAGIMFGTLMICFHYATKETFFWPLAVARLSAGVFLLFVMLILRAPVTIPMKAATIIPVAIAGCCDVAGNAFYSAASHAGRLDVAGVLGALYPAATVILARIILNERLNREQWLGVALALAAIVLVAI